MTQIDKNRFRFGKIGKGKKLHIFPKRLKISLCIRGPIKEGEQSKHRGECKDCKKEYKAVKNSLSFQMFVG